MDFLKEAKCIENEIISLRRDFHSYPELGFEEYETSKKIKQFLDKENIKYIESSKTGICALIQGKNNGKTIGLRADMDALPLQDKKTCDYASKVEGKMHACGHDAHTAILLGCAEILNSIRHEFDGNIKLFFEPAEETIGGARFMIKDGILENPHVDAVIGLHVDENIEVGSIGVKRGVVHAASNPFTIKIMGKGGHGAHPDLTVDPVVIASNVIIALQSVVSREISPTDAAVITVGTIHGGTAQNIIPEEVTISGILRTVKNEHREYVKERLKTITENITYALRGKCEIVIEESYPCLYNDDFMVDTLINSADKVIRKQKINILEKPSLGVESFAYFSKERPSVFYFLGSGNREKGIVNPTHGNYFDIDESCLAIGVALQCQTAVDFLMNTEK